MKPIRLKIVDGNKNVEFLYRDAAGRWHLISQSQIPLALANCTQRAAEMGFALEGCRTAAQALKVAREYIWRHYSVEVFK